MTVYHNRCIRLWAAELPENVAWKRLTYGTSKYTAADWINLNKA